MYVSEKEIRVRYAETDQMGVVHHGTYVIWAELLRDYFFEELGFCYKDMEEAGFLSPVVDIQFSYKKPVRYGEKVIGRVWLEEHSPVRTTYGYEICNGAGDVCASGFSKHTIVHKETFKPVSIKKVFPEMYQKYEEVKK